MSQEIERKFLVTEPPRGLNQYSKYEINQGYIVITDQIEVRLRKKGRKYYQTVKTGAGVKRGESEIELTEGQFEGLWPLTEGKRVEKTRYELPYGDNLIELDVYSGALRGLIVAEVEFKSEGDSSVFNPPDWFGMEVTEDGRYKNKNLALHGIPPKIQS